MKKAVHKLVILALMTSVVAAQSANDRSNGNAKDSGMAPSHAQMVHSAVRKFKSSREGNAAKMNSLLEQLRNARTEAERKAITAQIHLAAMERAEMTTQFKADLAAANQSQTGTK